MGELCTLQTRDRETEKKALRSMTGYVRRDIVLEGGERLHLEIQSLNRKHLDVITHIPKRFFHLDLMLRKEVAKYIGRGMVTLRLSHVGSPHLLESKQMVTQLATLKTKWMGIAEQLGLDFSPITLPFLLGFLGEGETADRATDELVMAHVQETLSQLIEVKEQEGAMLLGDMQFRVEQIRVALEPFDRETETAIIRYRARLDKLLTQLTLIDEGGKYGAIAQDDRVLKEIALFAEKIDVTEEKVRLLAHLSAFEQMMRQGPPESTSSRGSIGLSLEFLLQEMQREINTLGAKVSELRLSSVVLHMKGLLCQLKEQVANIE